MALPQIDHGVRGGVVLLAGLRFSFLAHLAGGEGAPWRGAQESCLEAACGAGAGSSYRFLVGAHHLFCRLFPLGPYRDYGHCLARLVSICRDRSLCSDHLAGGVQCQQAGASVVAQLPVG